MEWMESMFALEANHRSICVYPVLWMMWNDDRRGVGWPVYDWKCLPRMEERGEGILVRLEGL